MPFCVGDGPEASVLGVMGDVGLGAEGEVVLGYSV